MADKKNETTDTTPALLVKAEKKAAEASVILGSADYLERLVSAKLTVRLLTARVKGEIEKIEGVDPKLVCPACNGPKTASAKECKTCAHKGAKQNQAG